MMLRSKSCLCLVALLAGAGAARAGAECPPPVTETVIGVHAVDGGSFQIGDGRIVRLAGLAPVKDGRARLDSLVAGKPLDLRPIERSVDRWGRVVAYAETPGPERRSLAEALLSQGLGHVAATGRDPCLDPLFAAESSARSGRLGAWGRDGTLAPVTDGAALTARIGEHIVAEGTIVSARALRGRVYLNFARYWRSGLSVVIAERDWPAMGRGETPEQMVGRRLRVRGWLEWRNGPSIMANVLEPIEPVDGRPLER